MARRRLLLLVALLLVVVVVAFAAGDWVGQAAKSTALAQPTPTIDARNDIAPDSLIDNNVVSYYVHGRARQSAPFSQP